MALGIARHLFDTVVHRAHLTATCSCGWRSPVKYPTNVRAWEAYRRHVDEVEEVTPR